MPSVVDDLEESRRARQTLIRMQLEDDTRDDLLAFGMANPEHIGSSGHGPIDPATAWIASLDAEKGRAEKRRQATRALRNGRKICEGIGKIWPAAGKFLAHYYVTACSTWADAFEYSGISEPVGYKLRRTVLEWAESVGRDNVIAGVGIAEDRDGG